MNPAAWLNALLPILELHALLGRLFFASVEFAVLALAVGLLILVFRLRQPRLRALLWLVVLAKPLVGLALGMPLPLLALNLSAFTSAPAQFDERVEIKAPATVSLNAPPAPSAAAAPLTPLTTSKMAPAPGAFASCMIWLLARAPVALMAAWGLGAALFALRLVFSICRISRIKRQAEPPSPWVAARLDAIAREMGIAQAPRCIVTPALESPALVGFWRPAILLPTWVSEEADPLRVDWSLRHELMHWRLRDPLAALVVELVRILFFFHPAAWWAGRQWWEATEMACDRALVRSLNEAQAYAEQLCQMLKMIHQRRRLAVAGGLFAGRTQIRKRIESLATDPLRTPAHLSVATMALVLALSLASLTVGMGVKAADKPDAPASKSDELRPLRWAKPTFDGKPRFYSPQDFEKAKRIVQRAQANFARIETLQFHYEKRHQFRGWRRFSQALDHTSKDYTYDVDIRRSPPTMHLEGDQEGRKFKEVVTPEGKKGDGVLGNPESWMWGYLDGNSYAPYDWLLRSGKRVEEGVHFKASIPALAAHFPPDLLGRTYDVIILENPFEKKQYSQWFNRETGLLEFSLVQPLNDGAGDRPVEYAAFYEYQSSNGVQYFKAVHAWSPAESRSETYSSLKVNASKKAGGPFDTLTPFDTLPEGAPDLLRAGSISYDQNDGSAQLADNVLCYTKMGALGVAIAGDLMRFSKANPSAADTTGPAVYAVEWDLPATAAEKLLKQSSQRHKDVPTTGTLWVSADKVTLDKKKKECALEGHALILTPVSPLDGARTLYSLDQALISLASNDPLKITFIKPSSLPASAMRRIKVDATNMDSKAHQPVITEADKLAAEDLAAQGWRLWRSNKMAEAEDLFKRSLAKNPESADTWNGLGWAQFNQGKPFNAKRAFDRAVKLDPKHPAALDGLGWIAKGEGRVDEAIAQWKRAIEPNPAASTTALSGLASTYLEAKRFAEARRYYSLWLQYEPRNADAKAGLEKAQAAMDRNEPTPRIMKFDDLAITPSGMPPQANGARIETPDGRFQASADKVARDPGKKRLTLEGHVKLSREYDDDKGVTGEAERATLEDRDGALAVTLKGNAAIVQDNQNGQKVMTTADEIKIAADLKGRPVISLTMTSGRQPEIRAWGRQKEKGKKSSKSSSSGSATLLTPIPALGKNVD